VQCEKALAALGEAEVLAPAAELATFDRELRERAATL
jgi:hypothetical protein